MFRGTVVKHFSNWLVDLRWAVDAGDETCDLVARRHGEEIRVLAIGNDEPSELLGRRWLTLLSAQGSRPAVRYALVAASGAKIAQPRGSAELGIHVAQYEVRNDGLVVHRGLQGRIAPPPGVLVWTIPIERDHHLKTARKPRIEDFSASHLTRDAGRAWFFRDGMDGFIHYFSQGHALLTQRPRRALLPSGRHPFDRDAIPPLITALELGETVSDLYVRCRAAYFAAGPYPEVADWNREAEAEGRQYPGDSWDGLAKVIDSRVACMLLSHYYEHRNLRGFPDLLVVGVSDICGDAPFALVEVKGPSDQLRDEQRLMLAKLASTGALCGVLQVVPTP